MNANSSLAAATAAAGTLLLYPAVGLATDSKELAEIQQQIDALKSDYEAQIKALEARLQAAEDAVKKAESKADAAQATASAPTPVAQTPAPSGAVSANAFNPSIGVILDAKARYFSQDVDTFQIPGFSLPEEAGIGAEGLSLGESELNLAANVDDKFYGSLTVALEEEDGDTSVAVEEAYVQTLALPAGLTLKAGRFFSNVGYLNPTHTHADDFADRSLPHRVFLNKQFGDDGVQLRWIAPTDLFVEIGGELLRGASFPAAGASDNGKGMWTLFGHIGGDVGVSNSWRTGVSYISADADARETGDADAPDVFSGDSDLWIADFVWKWAPNGNPANRNFKLQAEYFFRNEDGRFTPAGGVELPLSIDQHGFYVQGIYQFMPQWRMGLRYAQLDSEDQGPEFADTALDNRGHMPWDLSAMIDWSNSEFSRVRLQYNRDESSLEPDDQIVLQYIMSLGAHGAHQF
jgi:hypothetical protein